MNNLYKKIFIRNFGIFTESEQNKIKNSIIALSGVGGVGGLLAERLMRLGVGKLKIIDPEVFEISNLNRQFSSSMKNLGKNKVEEIAIQIKHINPNAEIYYKKTGIKTQDNARNFLEDCNLIIDEMDFGLFKESIFLQRAAREKGIFYVFAAAIGFGALVVVFDPKGMTLAEYNNLSPNLELENIKQPKISLDKICPIIPSYVSKNIIKEIINGRRPVPTISIGVGLASILAANEAVNIILKKRKIITAPGYIYIDLLDQKFIIGAMS